MPSARSFGSGRKDNHSLRPPQRPYVSNLTGTWITPEQAQDPEHWVRHLREAGRSVQEIRRELSFGAGEPPRTRMRRDPSDRFFGEPDADFATVAYLAEYRAAIPIPDPRSGFSALAEQLGAGTAYEPSAAARSSDRVSFEVSPDVELNVRGPISEAQRMLVARCAMAICRILVGSAMEADAKGDDNDFEE